MYSPKRRCLGCRLERRSHQAHRSSDDHSSDHRQNGSTHEDIDGCSASHTRRHAPTLSSIAGNRRSRSGWPGDNCPCQQSGGCVTRRPRRACTHLLYNQFLCRVRPLHKLGVSEAGAHCWQQALDKTHWAGHILLDAVSRLQGSGCRSHCTMLAANDAGLPKLVFDNNACMCTAAARTACTIAESCRSHPV